MPFDWNGYLEVAENLKTETDGQPDNNTVQAKRRTAISRAYYAVYHLAEDYAIANLGYTPSKSGPNQHHTDVRSVYQRQFGNADHQEIRKMLMRLHKARIDSDYHPEDLGNVQSLLASTVLEANKIRGILTR